VLAKIAQLTGVDENGRRSRDEYLPPVPGGGDPCRAVHVDADVALVGDERRPCVDPDPHANRPTGEHRGCIPSSRQCSRRGRKGDEERVPLRVDLHAALRGERLSQHAAMLPERGRVLLGAQLVQQGGRALDVREEERDGSRREITPHRCHHAPEKTPTSSDSSPMAPPLHRYRAGLYALTVVPRAPNFCALRRVSSKLERA
jgi:hypothetical protein